jgi:hypothetical protein
MFFSNTGEASKKPIRDTQNAGTIFLTLVCPVFWHDSAEVVM